MAVLINGSSPALVFFDLETSGFKRDADILQIAMSSGSVKFNRYINPSQPIDFFASNIHHLKKGSDGGLYYVVNNIWTKLPSLPKHVVLEEMLNYLENFKRPCILIAHNVSFDYPRLISAIKEEGLENQFAAVVYGFTDTLKMMKNKFPNKKNKSDLKLVTLANELGLYTEGAHDAMVDVDLLETIAFVHFTEKQLVENSKSLAYILKIAFYKSELRPLQNHISNAMIDRLASFEISYDMLNTAYRRGGDVEAIALLEQRANGKPQAIKTKKILDKILDHLREQNPSIQERVDLVSDPMDLVSDQFSKRFRNVQKSFTYKL